MKNIFLIVLLFSSTIAKCQIQSNIITQKEFDDIEINNVKFSSLKNTLGKESNVENLLGIPSSKNIDPDGEFYHYEFNGFTIGFSSLISNGTIEKPIIGRFIITNKNYSIIITGVKLTIGDDISKLGTINFSENRDGSKYIQYQYCYGCNNFIYIHFNQVSKKITEIGFIELT
ncbi:hypothetical protein [uncultured Tenacibaculum sp.]|uniref:hypothetical protein n=1 Tax=uncultured Tenacibaculum sp. TaxID=174713 RepID=UPI00262B93FC|nr:hypothetical protein [uncultured Tenacibaculum sp.]